MGADEVTELSLVPWPAQVIRRPGAFVLEEGTRIQAASTLQPVVGPFAEGLRRSTGLPLPVVPGASGSRVSVDLLPALAGALGDEGYRLVVAPGLVEVQAARPAGVFYGLQTFRQLLPAQLLRPARATASDWRAPAVQIEDRPRFA